jgi:hypothetical protein
MKQFLRVILFFMVALILWGCPYESPYGIDTTELEDIDESLLGSWAAFVSKPCPGGCVANTTNDQVAKNNLR